MAWPLVVSCLVVSAVGCASRASGRNAHFIDCDFGGRRGIAAQINTIVREVESEAVLSRAERTTCAEGRCPSSYELECELRAPKRTGFATKSPLSPEEYHQVVDVVGRGENPPIVRIEDWSPDDAPDQPSSEADRVLMVTTWGGYNKCLHFGKNLGFAVERVRGHWRLIGNGVRFVDYLD